LPHAGAALRAMHRLGLLVHLFTEFQAIDSLVIRDYYHRYTVDEHSFVAIESLPALCGPVSPLERRFRDILDGIEQPEMLFLAILFHDVGKGMPTGNHISVNPEALTPWKAEMLWQLYAAAFNYMSRTVDDQRLHADSDEEHLKQVVSVAPGDVDSRHVRSFLEGFPKRYLLTHSPIDIVSHF